MAPPLPPPDLGARFTDMAFLGRGSTGQVWRAWDEVLQAEVAIKVLAHAADPTLRVRIKNEFRRLHALTHPNVVEVHELFVGPAGVWFSMEKVDGRPVDAAIRGDLPAGAPLPRASWPRAASAMIQLADAVAALHEAGLLHRDLKPGNALHQPSGRVVVLDLDLCAWGRARAWEATDPAIAGTVEYVAPEGLNGEASEAGDVYALGVMFHELLVGALPHRSLSEKLLGARTALGRAFPELPGASLVDAMLARDPEDRPTAAEVVAALRGTARPPSRRVAPFVGREALLDQLHAAWKPGGAALLLGPSGIGKTALGERFAREAAARGAEILRSRCHPDEQVAFRALDGVLDALRAHPEDVDTARLVRRGPLADGADVVVGRGQARADAWSRLAAALAVRADRRPLVLWLEDLHWADGDSLAALSVLAQVVPAFFVLSSRDGEEYAAALSRVVSAVPHARRVEVGPLPPPALRQIAQALGSEPGWDRAATDSAGHPLHYLELLRAPDGRDLADVLRRRIDALGDDARRILAAVAVAGAPLDVDLLLEVTSLPPSQRATLRGLEAQALLRATETAAGRGVVPFHDRVAVAVLSALPASARAGWHGRLADALARRPDPDPDELLRHLLGAGREVEAADAARRAADRAEARLAFHRAAALHQLILDRGWTPDPAATRARLADALATSGQTAAAAEAYAALARDAADPVEALQHRGRVATQRLIGGDVEGGLDALRGVLRDLGVRVPGPWMAAVHAIGWRLRVWVRGLELATPSEVGEVDRLRLGLLWVSAATLAHQAPLVGDALGARLVWDALRTGDRRRASMALAFKAGADAILLGRRGRERALDLIARAARLADGGPGEVAYCHAVEGPVRWARGEMAEAERAVTTFLGKHPLLRPIVPVGPSTILSYLFAAMAHQGKLDALARVLPPAWEEAVAAGDRLSQATHLLGWPTLGWLWLDRVDALTAARDALVAGLPRAFGTQRYHALITDALTGLYRGRPADALAALDAGWGAFTRSGILGIDQVASEMWFTRARVLRAALDAGAPEASPRALRRARDRVARIPLPATPALVALLDAGTPSALIDAAAGAERAGMPHLAAAARVRAGHPEGLRWFVERGAVRPDAIARALG